MGDTRQLVGKVRWLLLYIYISFSVYIFFPVYKVKQYFNLLNLIQYHSVSLDSEVLASLTVHTSLAFKVL